MIIKNERKKNLCDVSIRSPTSSSSISIRSPTRQVHES